MHTQTDHLQPSDARRVVRAMMIVVKLSRVLRVHVHLENHKHEMIASVHTFLNTHRNRHNKKPHMAHTHAPTYSHKHTHNTYIHTLTHTQTQAQHRHTQHTLISIGTIFVGITRLKSLKELRVSEELLRLNS